MSEVITFLVRGVPAPQGSMRAFDSHVVPAKNAPYLTFRADIRTEADKCWSHPWVGQPIWVAMRFVFPRPQSHFLPVNKTRQVPVLRVNAPEYVTSRPDVDKLVRAVLDALTGIAYADDAQVVQVTGTKVYDPGDGPGHTRIQIGRY